MPSEDRSAGVKDTEAPRSDTTRISPTRSLTGLTSNLRDATPPGPTLRWVGAVIVVWAVVYGRGLSQALAIYDESIYAASARLMLQRGEFLVPTIQGGLGGTAPHLFLEKPPLAIWFQAGSIALFGPSEFAVRMPSILFVLGTALLVLWLGRRVISRPAGGFAAVVFLTTPHLFEGMNSGRDAVTDPALLFFGTLALVLLWFGLAERRQRLLVTAGAAGGLAALAKGFAVVTYALAALVLLVAYRDRIDWRPLLGGTAAGVVVGGWWPLLMWLRFGETFLQQFLYEQALERGSNNAIVLGTEYVRMLPWSFGPWLYLLVPLCVAIWLDVRTGESRTQRLFAGWLGLWSLLVFGFFVVFGSHFWYVLPAYVPLALLVGWGLSLAVRGGRPARLAVVVSAVATLAVSYRTSIPHYVAIVLVGGTLLALAPTLREYTSEVRAATDWPVVRSLAVCWLVLLAVGLTIPAYQGGQAPAQRALGGAIAAETTADATLHVGPGVSRNLFPLSFYSGRTLADVDRSALETGSVTGVALLRQSTVAQLDQPYTVVHEESTLRGDLVVVRLPYDGA